MKRIISTILMCTIILSTVFVYSPPAYAFPGNYFWFPHAMHVRIYHPSSGMYLGIDRNGNEVDGARIQLQRYEEGNQNQIFYLQPIEVDSNGRMRYQIRVHGETEKIIEIRNSSHEDWAEAAQWTTHYNDCAKWYFYTQTNRNGYDSAICCIKNVESGKMLNVANNNAFDGNNLIQYHEDGTGAEMFQIFSVEDQIIGATWSRDWYGDAIKGFYWSTVNDTKSNRNKYFTPINLYINGNIGYPVVYEKEKMYLANVIWADATLQKKILQLRNPPKSGYTKIQEQIASFGKDAMLDFLFENIPIPLGNVDGIVSAILLGQSEQQWYYMEKAFSEHSKVRIEIYYKFDGGNWGVNCTPYVNEVSDTYWNGNKSDIGNSIKDYYGEWINGNVEYFYK